MASSFQGQRLSAEQVRANFRKSLSKVADPLDKATIVFAIKDDPDGLMPADKVGDDIDVMIPVWPDRLPGATSKLYLEYWYEGLPDYVPIHEDPEEVPDSKPVGEFPLDRKIPLQIFEGREGTFQFRYRVVYYNFNESFSTPTPVTIDTLGPLQPDASPEAMQIAEPMITDATLARDNGVKCVVPPFVENKKEFVRVAVGWMATLPEDESDFPDLVAVFELLPQPSQEVVVPKKWITDLGSIVQYVVYFLFDKAGNRSQMSLPKSVKVALGELPADMEICEVPLEKQDGLYDRADAGIPPTVVIKDYTGSEGSDGIVIQWGDTTLARTSVEAHLPWAFTYQTVNGLLCITEATTPTGAVETVEYAGIGHAFPGFVRPPLPRVWKHIVKPGFGQAPIEVHYDYNTVELPGSNNFLGNNSNTIVWDDGGLDNLYQDSDGYQYGTTERHFDGGVEVRTIERTFNRFHLITEEKTTQGNTVQQVFTTYYADDDLDLPFQNQPPQCQLPLKVETRFSLKDGSIPARSQTVSTGYDTHGNLTEQIQANGIKEEYEYFPVAGIKDECPADPQGFVRSLRQKTVTPATGRESGAPVLRTRNVYALMDPLDSPTVENSDNWLVLTGETLFEVNGTQEVELQKSTYVTSDTPEVALLHGRRTQQTVTLNGLSTTTEYTYEKLKSLFVGETVLQTTETLTGYDHGTDGAFTQKKVILEHSLLHGEPLLTRDDNDVEIRTTYDALLRVTSETVAPNTDYVATRSYRYFLRNSSDEQAGQEVTDVKGVKTKTLFDGLNRVVKEQRQDKDHQTGAKADIFRDTYVARYNALGQLEEETERDWCSANAAEDLVLVSQYRYDDWGAQSSLVRPDKVEEHEVTDPIRQTVTAWVDGLGKTVTHTNLFDKPDSIQRYALNDEPTDPQAKPYSEHAYHYDGLGRTAHEFDALLRKTAYVYDGFDRMLRTTLPDNAQVERRYALHSSEDLPVWIGVHANGNVKELGEQAFDGLDRMKRSITGGRVTSYQFKQGELKPCKVIRPSKVEVDYEYAPALGEEPLKRTTSSTVIASTYDYDEQNARLRSSEESGVTLSREYHSTGEIKSETREQSGQKYTMVYDYSRQARLLKYVDVLNQEQVYDYNIRVRSNCRTTTMATSSSMKKGASCVTTTWTV